MSQLLSKLEVAIEQLYAQAVKDRRHLHQYPELSFEEYKTSAYIQERLASLDIPCQIVAKTGVVAVLEGEKSASSAIVVLRADIDALPIEELNDVDYKSVNKGVMHACGHDYHTANLLAAAAVLKDCTAEFSGKILLLFQPAEEKIPGGAIQVLESGVLESFEGTIKAVVGMHVSPRLAAGKLGVCGGRFMASSDEFYITIKGRGGHAAEPHRAIDPIMIAVQLLTTLQQVVSRKADPNIPSVLTFGRFEGHGAANVIPEEVRIAGTFRTMDEAWRKTAVQQIEEIIKSLPASLGASVDLEVRQGYPVLYNDDRLAELSTAIWQEHLGKDSVENPGIWMAAEDFAYYSHKYPSLFVLVGTDQGAVNTQYGLHNPRFNLAEQAFMTSISALSHLALSLLNENT